MTAADTRDPKPAPTRRHRATASEAAAALGLLFALALGTTAILSATGCIAQPYELHLLALRLPFIFPIHMAVSGLAAILIVLALAAHRQPSWHRPIGRLAAAAVLVGGLTALPSALLSEASTAARAAFFVQGCAWLLFLASGLVAVRQGHGARHRRAMVAMAAVASGAIWLRLALWGIAYAELPHEPSYAIAAWAAWLVPLGLVCRYTVSRRGNPWRNDRSRRPVSAAS